MNNILFASALTALAVLGTFNSTAFAADPCEDVLKTLNDAMATAKLSDADAKTVADLKAKGEERCTAEDDRRADGFFNDALAIVTKK